MRSKTYPSAIETDFTVSDIEAAMATVRTVSPPRKNAPAPPLTDSDLRVLGGPTMPSPHEDPPAASPPPAAPKPPAAAPRPAAVTAEEEEAARFVDFDVPPMPAPNVKRSAPAKEPPPHQTFDFALDLPSDLKATEFDGATSNAYKRTLVEQIGSPPLNDPNAPRASLDLELPSRSDIGVPMTPASQGTPAPLSDEERHGATALDQLFATDTGKFGPDTILDLDDRSGVQLTQADLATMVVVATGNERSTLQQRMARFGDVMNQVDELAGSDALRAIALLRQYVLRDEDIPTILWLRLFELYRLVAKKSVYEALAEHFSRRYHRPMVPWEQTLADKVPQTPLSARREIDAEIESLWGTPEGLEKLHGLLCGHDQPDDIVFNGVLQRDLLDAAKVFLLDRDSSITKNS